MNTNPIIFDRKRVRMHRDRASSSIAVSDFLLHEMALRMAERLQDFGKISHFALELGAHTGQLRKYLQGAPIEMLVQTDLSEAMIGQTQGACVVVDEEYLPFANESFDLIMSVSSLHWINDLPGTLIQIQRCLKPEGLFIAMVPGGETLTELRQSLEYAEMEVSGGISPHISPFIDIKDAGSLLQRTGFTEPVIDSEILNIVYEDPLALLYDLRNMGETNALMANNQSGLKRSVLSAAMKHYRAQFPDNENEANKNRYNATFEIVTLTAWKNHARRA